MDINVFAKFYEILSLPLQDIKKPKRRGRTDRQRENSIPPQTQFAGYNIIKQVSIRSKSLDIAGIAKIVTASLLYKRCDSLERECVLFVARHANLCLQAFRHDKF